MNEIYWITRLDLIGGWLIAFSIIAGILTFISACFYLDFRSDCENMVTKAINDGWDFLRSHLKYY